MPDRRSWFFGFNLPCYGGSLRFAPDADGSDGLLDVCTFRRGSLWHGLRYLAAVKLGTPSAAGRLRPLAGRGVFGSPPRREVPYQLDGDPGGVLPVEIEMVPSRMTWVVPPERRQLERMG